MLRTLALAPVIIPQALWVAARTTRLPEASGDRTGDIGSGPLMHLLVLGDSSAAGVGVATQSDALAGRLAVRMAEHFSVRWQVVARSGATVRSATRMVVDVQVQPFDAVLVALGVNDAKNGVSLKRWTSGYRHLLNVIEDRFSPRLTCVTGLPPFGEFRILPAPLKHVLGDRAELFDRHLQQIADERAGTVHLPFDLALDNSKLATDGFHPGPDIYDAWAQRAAHLFTQKLF